jgi:hypothetical protein
MTTSTGWTVYTLVVMLWLVSPLPAQQKARHDADETTAQVPALANFHEVIFQIWHTGWPEKNIAMLCHVLPDVQRHCDSLRQAHLPGILRDKQKTWDENVERLSVIVNEYASATSPVDSQKLLNAAEKLHAQYEKLVRLTRPVLRELDEFHQVLYMLYHHYLPDNDQEKIVSSVRALKEKMVLLERAKLADRLKSRETSFSEARKNLARSVAALDSVTATADPSKFASEVEAMHGDYQLLEKVFE